MEKIQNAYDIKNFYEQYKDMRDKKINANELIEMPIIKAMLPALDNLSIIDLGCGNGTMSKYFIDQGAKYVLGLDVSHNMINEAKEVNNDKKIDYEVLPMEQLSTLKNKFDIVYSSLAFHYIEDFDKLIKDISLLLNKDGMLIFSQEHPLVTATILSEGQEKKTQINNKRYYYLSDYNNNSKRIVKWNDEDIVKYHRNFSFIINTLIKYGFEIMEIQESTAIKEAVEVVEKYKYLIDRPYFLFVKAVKI